jgi:hypothetical protein
VARLAPVAFVACLALAPGARAGFDQELAKLYDKAEEARLAAGWYEDQEAVRARHPAPPLSLARPVEARPGKAVTVSLRGKVAPDTAILVRSTEARLASRRDGPQGVELVLEVRPDALPLPVAIHAFASVSLEETVLEVARIAGPATVELETDNGWRGVLSLTTKGAQLTGRSDWSRTGEKAPFRRAPMTLAADAESITGTFEYTVEEQRQALKDLERLFGDGSAPPPMVVDEEASRQMAREVQRCFAIEEDGERDRCMDELGRKTEKLLEEGVQQLQKRVAETPSGASAFAFGCEELRLRREGGGLGGELVNCQGSGATFVFVNARVRR